MGCIPTRKYEILRGVLIGTNISLISYIGPRSRRYCNNSRSTAALCRQLFCWRFSSANSSSPLLFSSSSSRRPGHCYRRPSS